MSKHALLRASSTLDATHPILVPFVVSYSATTSIGRGRARNPTTSPFSGVPSPTRSPPEDERPASIGHASSMLDEHERKRVRLFHTSSIQWTDPSSEFLLHLVSDTDLPHRDLFRTFPSISFGWIRSIARATFRFFDVRSPSSRTRARRTASSYVARVPWKLDGPRSRSW